MNILVFPLHGEQKAEGFASASCPRLLANYLHNLLVGKRDTTRREAWSTTQPEKSGIVHASKGDFFIQSLAVKSVRRPTAVDGNISTSHAGGGIATQEQGEVADFSRLHEALERYVC